MRIDERAKSVQRFFLAPGVSPEERRRYSTGTRSPGSSSTERAVTWSSPPGLTRVYADERYVFYRVDGRQEEA